MNVVIYARYSSHNQTEQSIEGQLKECYAFAKRNDYIVVEEYIDRAISGTSDNRPQFRKMIDDSSKKHFNGVLVYQFDRFARNRYDSAMYKHRLKKNGVRVYSARENISDDASGVLMESMLEGMAEYYSAELSQKVKRGMSINASKYLYTGGSVPLGFRITEEKNYQVDEDSASTVRRIFAMYVSSSTMAEITKYLNHNQVTTSYGNEFNKNSLHNILLNKKYIGTYTYNGNEYVNAIPAIVDEKLFNKAQFIMKKNKQAPARSRAKADYLLTTKLFCGECKEMMVGVSGTSHTGSIYNYYRCKNKQFTKCRMKNVRKAFAEDLVVAEARNVLTDDNIRTVANAVVDIAKKENNLGDVKRLTKMIKDNEKQRLNLMESIKICEIDSVKLSLFEEMARMDASYKLLQGELSLEEASQVKVSASQIRFFLSKIRSGDINDEQYKKMLVSVLIDKIYLYDDKMILYFNTNTEQSTVVTSKALAISEVESSFIALGAQPRKNDLHP
jgi:site-specific DNA recombinase